MTTLITAALHASSPRFSPIVTPWRSVAIHGMILIMWLILFGMAFTQKDIFAWSVGIIYIIYDTVLLAFVFWKTRCLLENKPPSPIGTRNTLSVIVAAYNEAAVLPITLKALLNQSDPADHIIIADDGSMDYTKELLQHQYGLRPPNLGEMSPPSSLHPTLRWLRLPHAGKANALNATLPLINTEIVLTVDGDTLLEQSAIAAVRRAFSSEPELVAATGILTPICAQSFVGSIFQWFQTYEYIRNFLSRYAWMRVNSLLLISGAFASFRSNALLTLGGFDPECMVEDYELIHRMQRYAIHHQLPWRIRVLGDAQALTDAPSNIGAFLRQRRRWFEGFLQTQYWYRDMVGNKRYGLLGLLMLPVKAADTLQPIYGLTAFCLLIYFLTSGLLHIVTPIAIAIGIKIVIDLAFHLWSIRLYQRWIGNTSHGSITKALLAAIAEPFTFQILRHLGAMWGWISALTGYSTSWGKQTRMGLFADNTQPVNGKIKNKAMKIL